MESTPHIPLETIKNLLTLPPLPKLDGYVPQGWKEAIYPE